MHKKARFTFFLYLVCFALFCTGIAGSISKEKGKNLKEIKTALLNPKYAPQVNHIRIKDEDSQTALVLKKNAELWTAELFNADLEENGRKISFPADSRRVEELIDTSKKIIGMYTVSYSPIKESKKSSLLGENQRTFVFEFLDNEKTFSHFYIKKSADSSKKLYIGTAGSKSGIKNKFKNTLYAASDDLSAFLSINPALWADGKLFSDYIRGGKNTADVQKIVYSAYDASGRLLMQKSLAAGDKVFDKAVYDLFSARTSKILPRPQKAFFEQLTESYEIDAEFSNGEKARIFIYTADGGFFVIPECLDYALEISSWTGNRIGIGSGLF